MIVLSRTRSNPGGRCLAPKREPELRPNKANPRAASPQPLPTSPSTEQSQSRSGPLGGPRLLLRRRLPNKSTVKLASPPSMKSATLPKRSHLPANRPDVLLRRTLAPRLTFSKQANFRPMPQATKLSQFCATLQYAKRSQFLTPCSKPILRRNNRWPIAWETTTASSAAAFRLFSSGSQMKRSMKRCRDKLHPIRAVVQGLVPLLEGHGRGTRPCTTDHK